jgi:hypothetical protein
LALSKAETAAIMEKWRKYLELAHAGFKPPITVLKYRLNGTIEPDTVGNNSPIGAEKIEGCSTDLAG